MGKKTSPKKYTAAQKKEYVLNHLGVMTYENMALQLDCTEQNVYLILGNIRKERDLINPDLVTTAAEEQYNRLNSSVKLAYSNLMKEYKKINDQSKLYNQDPKKNNPPDERQMYTKNRMYIEAEKALTQFLKATGLYRQDLIIDASQHDNNLTVVFNTGMKDSKLPSNKSPPKKKEREVNPKKGKKK